MQFTKISASSKQYKPWRGVNDPEEVLFISTHILDVETKSFYPGTGEDTGKVMIYLNKYIGNTKPSDLDVWPGGILNIPIAPRQCRGSSWRKAYSEKVLPRLKVFQPDFIFVSAGFDAHEKDHLHNSGDTKVTEFEYQWVTEQLV